MKAEQELIEEGTDREEVQKLCDVHSSLFHGLTREEKIANAEKDVISSANKALVNNFKNESIFNVLKETKGHPVETFLKENEEIEKLIQSLFSKLDANEDISNDLMALNQIKVHYAKKGDLLYPLLDNKYDITGPSNVMWGVDDEIKTEISYLLKNQSSHDRWFSKLQDVLNRAIEMTYKEDNILLPLCSENFSNQDWIDIYKDSKDYVEIFNVKNQWSVGDNATSSHESSFINDEIIMPGGHLTPYQLTHMLNTIPLRNHIYK